MAGQSEIPTEDVEAAESEYAESVHNPEDTVNEEVNEEKYVDAERKSREFPRRQVQMMALGIIFNCDI